MIKHVIKFEETSIFKSIADSIRMFSHAMTICRIFEETKYSLHISIRFI